MLAAERDGLNVATKPSVRFLIYSVGVMFLRKLCESVTEKMVAQRKIAFIETIWMGWKKVIFDFLC